MRWGRQLAADVRHAACSPGTETTGGSLGLGLDDFAVVKVDEALIGRTTTE